MNVDDDEGAQRDAVSRRQFAAHQRHDLVDLSVTLVQVLLLTDATGQTVTGQRRSDPDGHMLPQVTRRTKVTAGQAPRKFEGNYSFELVDLLIPYYLRL